MVQAVTVGDASMSSRPMDAPPPSAPVPGAPPQPPLPPPPPPPPRPPRPTATPTPWPYEYSAAGGRGNCTFTGVYGYVLGADGLPEVGVQVRAGNNQNWRTDATTDVNGLYVIKFWDGAKEGMWFVRVFKGGQPRSEQFWWKTSAGCDGPYSLQEVQIDWKHR
jgi:hypothetical protein